MLSLNGSFWTLISLFISMQAIASGVKNVEIKRPVKLKFQDVEYRLDVSFSNINIGRLSYSVKSSKKNVQTIINLKTNSFYDFIFKIRDQIIGEYNLDSLSPKKFIFHKKEGKKESYVSMDFEKEKIIFNEKWRKRRKKGSKNKTYSSSGRDYFDITLMINYLIFSENELELGSFFWLALKSSFYKVTLNRKEKVKVSYQGQQHKGVKYWFKSIKGEKSEKRGEFSIVILKSQKPLFFELEGLMKIGKIKGVLTNVK